MTKEKGLLGKIKEWFVDEDYAAATDSGDGPFSKEELRQRLIALSQSTPPPKENMEMGAMCYKPAPWVGTVDVVCSSCKQKNIVRKDHHTATLQDMDRLVQLLQKSKRSLEVQYDNRFCCTACNPSLKGVNGPIEADEIDRRLYLENDEKLDGCYLIIKFKDQDETRRVKIDLRGLRLLVAFIQGKKKVRNDDDREHPLKDSVKQIGRILGIKDYQTAHDM